MTLVMVTNAVDSSSLYEDSSENRDLKKGGKLSYLAIEVELNEVDGIKEELQAEGVSVEVVRSNGFDASSVATLVVELSPIVAGLVATIYGIRKKSEKHISLKYKGMEVKGVSEKTLIKLIEHSKE